MRTLLHGQENLQEEGREPGEGDGGRSERATMTVCPVFSFLSANRSVGRPRAPRHTGHSHLPGLGKGEAHVDRQIETTTFDRGRGMPSRLHVISTIYVDGQR